MASIEVGAGELLKLAIAAVNSSDLAEAETLCRQVVQTDEVGDAYYILGFIALQQGKHAEAVANCSRAATLGSGGWHNQLLLGAAHTALGQLALAHQALLDGARQNPGDVETALRLLNVTLAHHGAAHAEATYGELFAPLGVREIDDGWMRMALQAGVVVTTSPGVRLVPQDTALAWARRSGVEVLEAGEVEAIPIQTIGDDAPSSHVMGNTPYVVDLPDVQVFAYSHVVLSADGFALNEAGGHAEYGRFVDHHSDAAVVGQKGDKLLIRPGAYEMQDLDEGIWLAGPASDAFGHWVGEFAPRLQFLEQHPAFAGRPIIIDEGMPASHLELLGMICSNPLVTLRRGQGLRVRRLLYAPTPTFFPIHLLPNDVPPFVACCCSVRTYRFLKDRVERALGVAPPTGAKYYLSRANRSWRRIRNEDEVRSYLESHGYQTVMTEGLSFAEQVRLFQGAASIMAPTGSAMQNFIFAPQDVGLFVLTQLNVHNHAAFNGQARALGYDPQFVCGHAAGDAAQKHTDYIIPIEALAPAVA
jgi:capsular polysaccharide biosynthesis protein